MSKLVMKLDNGMEITCEGSREEIIEEISFWQMFPSQCPVCDAKVRFNVRNIKDCVYNEVICFGEPYHRMSIRKSKKNNQLYVETGEPFLTIEDAKKYAAARAAERSGGPSARNTLAGMGKSQEGSQEKSNGRVTDFYNLAMKRVQEWSVSGLVSPDEKKKFITGLAKLKNPDEIKGYVNHWKDNLKPEDDSWMEKGTEQNG